MININNDLYKYLIKKFHISYIEMPEEVKYNLHNDEKTNIKYLGTYFLKSYKETYTFFTDNLLYLYNNGFLNEQKTINILDFGSGTGGQLFGLLHAINNQYTNELQINIHSIDGNKNALDIQQTILNDYWRIKYKNSISFFHIFMSFQMVKVFIISYIITLIINLI